MGNDVEDEAPIPLATREVVRNTGSSKKADVAPASADPAKAKKKSKPTGNEGALKSKPNNKATAAPSLTPSKHYKKPLDRHSRSQKTDSSKKIKAGWGDEKDELHGEAQGLADAAEELEADDEQVVSQEPPKQSLSDYFAELQVKQANLDNQKAVRQANEGAEDKWTAAERIEKQREAYIESSVAKKNKQKAAKEKKFLDFEATFGDSAPQQAPRGESQRGNFKRGGRRGGAPAQSGRKPASGKPAGKPAAAKPANLEKDFPSL